MTADWVYWTTPIPLEPGDTMEIIAEFTVGAVDEPTSCEDICMEQCQGPCGVL